MRHFICLMVVLMVLGCGNSDRPSKPDNLIPEETMSKIIYDVFLLNAAKGVNKRVLEQNGIFPQEYVFKKYDIDSLQFAKSNDYYSYDTKTYEDIINRVQLKIETEKIKIDTLIAKEGRTKDSLKKLIRKERDSIKSVNTKFLKPDTLSDPKPKLKSQQKPKIFGQDNN